MDTSAEIPASPLLPWSNVSRAGCPGPVLLTGSSACRVGAVRAAALKVGLRKGNGPQGTEIPCSPTAGLKAVRLPPLSTLYQLYVRAARLERATSLKLQLCT